MRILLERGHVRFLDLTMWIWCENPRILSYHTLAALNDDAVLGRAQVVFPHKHELYLVPSALPVLARNFQHASVIFPSPFFCSKLKIAPAIVQIFPIVAGASSRKKREREVEIENIIWF